MDEFLKTTKERTPVRGQCCRCKVNRATSRVEGAGVYCSGCVLQAWRDLVERAHEEDPSPTR